MGDRWNKLATLNGVAVGNALAVLEVEPFGAGPQRHCCPIGLQRFGNTALFRLVLFSHTHGRPCGSFCLPTDARWQFPLPRKVASASGTRAIKLELHFPAATEGYVSIKLWIPYSDDAELFGAALRFAEQTVAASLE